MKEVNALEQLELLGSTQWGLVTTAQAQAHGISRLRLSRLADKGTAIRVRHGVYALPSARDSPLQDLQAAWLATDPENTVDQRATTLHSPDAILISHQSAAQVHGLGELVPARHEFASASRRQSARDDVRFHRTDVPDSDRVLVDGMAVTSIERTVADLADARVDFDHLAQVVRDAIQTGQTSPDELASRLDRSAGHYGSRCGRDLVENCLKSAGLPKTAADIARWAAPSPASGAFSTFTDMLRPLVDRQSAMAQELARPTARVSQSAFDSLARAMQPVFESQQKQTVEALLQFVAEMTADRRHIDDAASRRERLTVSTSDEE